MNPAWLQKIEAEWNGKDIWKTGKELMDEESGIITTLS